MEKRGITSRVLGQKLKGLVCLLAGLQLAGVQALTLPELPCDS